MSQAQQRVTVSVILPTFNRAAILCQTIEMLRRQTDAPHEIIVVDQSTVTDAASEATLTRWNEQGEIVWIRQTEPNASMARNRGALASSGDVLLFLDDDITLAERFIECHARNYQSPEVRAVAGQILDEDSPVTLDLPKLTGDPQVDWIYFPKNYGRRCQTPWMASGNFSVRRDIYFQLGGMDETYWKGGFREEADFALRFVRSGYRFEFDPEASVFHLGIKAVPVGGSRPRDFGFGMWHHIFGAWSFLVGFGTLRSIPILLFSSFRGFVLNQSVLKTPRICLPRLLMWFAGFPAALFTRCKLGFKVNSPMVQLAQKDGAA
jgi:glycosyltransferase involved in cell wall biosynthesis